MLSTKGVVSKETVVLRRWGSSIHFQRSFRLLYAIAKIAFITAKIIASLDESKLGDIK